MEYDQILPEIYVGSYPASTEDIDNLRLKLGASAVMNLQTDADFAQLGCNWNRLQTHYRRSKIEVRRVPINDFDSAQLRKKLPDAVQVLNELLRADHIVYLHCTGGMERAPSVAAAYMHWIQQLDLDKAVRYVVSCRRCTPDVEAIRLASEDLLQDA
jgi:protein-tyrosine phosphatase